jgi:hypothetical protein
VQLLQHKMEDIHELVAEVLHTLADSCSPNQSLIGAVANSAGGAISRLWQLTRSSDIYEAPKALAAVIKGHNINQSHLMHEDNFTEDLLKLLAQEAWRFVAVATALHQDSAEFVLRLRHTPAAVPSLTAC